MSVSTVQTKITALHELPGERFVELYQTINDCWNKSHSYYMTDERHDRYASFETFQSEISRGKADILFDMTHQRIAGSIQYHFTYKGHNSYFGTLCIGSAYQGKSLAEKLITHVEHQSIMSNCSHIYIWVVSCAEKLQGYYGRLGYRVTGEKFQRDIRFLQGVKPEFRHRVDFQEMAKPLLLPSRLVTKSPIPSIAKPTLIPSRL